MKRYAEKKRNYATRKELFRRPDNGTTPYF